MAEIRNLILVWGLHSSLRVSVVGSSNVVAEGWSWQCCYSIFNCVSSLLCDCHMSILDWETCLVPVFFISPSVSYRMLGTKKSRSMLVKCFQTFLSLAPSAVHSVTSPVCESYCCHFFLVLMITTHSLRLQRYSNAIRWNRGLSCSGCFMCLSN